MSPQARLWHRLSATTFLFLCTLVVPRANAVEAPAAPTKKVREPAVAGLFYPKDPVELTKEIDACLVSAKVEPTTGELKALICPHAGYPYSGPVAAYAYRLLAGREYATVVVLGPSHYADLHAA